MKTVLRVTTLSRLCACAFILATPSYAHADDVDGNSQNTLSSPGRGEAAPLGKLNGVLHLAQNRNPSVNPADSSAPTGASASTAENKGSTHSGRTLEEIVVTAQKRGEQYIQDTPISIDAVTDKTLQNTNATGLQDLSRLMSSVTVRDFGTGKQRVNIRGVSSAREASETVAIYLDDVPITGSGNTQEEDGTSPDISLFDMERVEVLKGPQSTLYGASSMGGTIRYIMNRPSVSGWDGKVAARVSTTSHGASGWATDFMLNAPVADTVAVRFTGFYKDVGGYIDNLVATGLNNETKRPPQNDVNSERDTGFTISGLWQVTDKFSLLGRYLRRDLKVDGDSTVNRSTFNLLGEAEPVLMDKDDLKQIRYTLKALDEKMDIASLTAEWKEENFTITSSSSYLNRDIVDPRDESRVPMAIFGSLPGQAPSSYVRTTVQEQLVEELRISFDNGGPVTGVGGLYYNKTDKEFHAASNGPGIDQFIGIDSTQFGAPKDVLFFSNALLEVEQTALFGEVTYKLGQWDLTAGLRWFEIELAQQISSGGFFQGGLTGSPKVSAKESDFNPKVSVSRRFNDDVLMYLTAAKGYRQGGANAPAPQTLCEAELAKLGLSEMPSSYGSDSIWSYELGLKSTLLEGTLRLNAAYYHIDWKDIQGRISMNGGDCFFGFFANISKAKVDGFELSVLGMPTDNLELSLNVGYVDSRTAGADPYSSIPSGTKTPGVSDFTFSAAAVYEFALFRRSSSVRVDYTYQSETNTLYETYLSENRKIMGFGLFNANLDIDVSEQVSVGLYGKNITDVRGVTGAYADLMGDDLYIVRPREIGFRFAYRF